MQNYFNYFTEIEEHFQRRRGSLLLLSTLDWALIETWREAGIPLEAILRGIDAAFDKHDASKSRARVRRVNGLAYCAQAVMAAVEDIKEASIGAAKPDSNAESATGAAPGFEQARIAAHLRECAAQLDEAKLAGIAAETAQANAISLQLIAGEVMLAAPNLEELERRMTVMEEKLLSAITATAPEAELVALRTESARELAPYRARMQTTQIRQIEQQFLQKRLLEKYKLPRLSLFYMRQG
ncbi:hypothetical protein HNQ77_005065 [Silvibacterium bohemicum]|uniref:Uncharacterized protein n=1 Tax=Silvibacterium bohemicum TaxID=1577686 RepID=A0A841K109_9BACT|nr:hypothetical protein [Silvibacterium bohemicum]MBB6147080.1 hypothetical protein [Silvibacterium bohemicum]